MGKPTPSPFKDNVIPGLLERHIDLPDGTKIIDMVPKDTFCKIDAAHFGHAPLFGIVQNGLINSIGWC